MIEEDPLHPSFVELEVGDWMEFAVPGSHHIGQILEKKGRSLLVLYQARSTPTGIPDAEMYFQDADDPRRQTTIRKIEPQVRIPAPTGERISLAQAAAILGTTVKGVRQMLRDGELEGRQAGGKWKWVKLDG